MNSKCHNQKGYSCLYEAEQFTIHLGRFLVHLKCFITYVTCVVVICLICLHLPLCSCKNIRKITPAHLTYITCSLAVAHDVYLYPNAWEDQSMAFTGVYLRYTMGYVLVITRPRRICLIYMPKPEGRRPEGAGIYIRQITSGPL